MFQDILGENLVFPYGYSAGYGIGFAAPFLLPSYLDSCEFDCSAADFSAVIYQYGLQYGVQGQHIGESKLDNFGRDAKQALRDVLSRLSRLKLTSHCCQAQGQVQVS